MDYLGQSGTIWNYLGLFGTIWDYLGLSRTIPDYPGLSGTQTSVQVEAREQVIAIWKLFGVFIFIFFYFLHTRVVEEHALLKMDICKLFMKKSVQ